MNRYFLVVLFLNSFLFSLSGQCVEDCVWPGDLNANGIVNNMDLLAVGLAFLEEGPPRQDQSTDWSPKEAEDWPENYPVSGANLKHGDATGDGQIDDLDAFIISDNFLETNDNFSGLLGNIFPGDQLRFIGGDEMAVPGDTFLIDIHLGSPENPVEGIYGLAFSVEIDPDQVSDISVDFSDTWLGEQEELLNTSKFFAGLDANYLAVTRLDHQPVSGGGK